MTEHEADTTYARQALGDVFADAWWLWECKDRMVSPRLAILTSAHTADPIIREEAMNCWMSYERQCFLAKRDPEPGFGFRTILKELAWRHSERGQA